MNEEDLKTIYRSSLGTALKVAVEMGDSAAASYICALLDAERTNLNVDFKVREMKRNESYREYLHKLDAVLADSDDPEYIEEQKSALKREHEEQVNALYHVREYES